MTEQPQRSPEYMAALAAIERGKAQFIEATKDFETFSGSFEELLSECNNILNMSSEERKAYMAPIDERSRLCEEAHVSMTEAVAKLTGDEQGQLIEELIDFWEAQAKNRKIFFDHACARMNHLLEIAEPGIRAPHADNVITICLSGEMHENIRRDLLLMTLNLIAAEDRAKRIQMITEAYLSRIHGQELSLFKGMVTICYFLELLPESSRMSYVRDLFEMVSKSDFEMPKKLEDEIRNAIEGQRIFILRRLAELLPQAENGPFMEQVLQRSERFSLSADNIKNFNRNLSSYIAEAHKIAKERKVSAVENIFALCEMAAHDSVLQSVTAAFRMIEALDNLTPEEREPFVRSIMNFCGGEVDADRMDAYDAGHRLVESIWTLPESARLKYLKKAGEFLAAQVGKNKLHAFGGAEIMTGARGMLAEQDRAAYKEAWLAWITKQADGLAAAENPNRTDFLFVLLREFSDSAPMENDMVAVSAPANWIEGTCVVFKKAAEGPYAVMIEARGTPSEALRQLAQKYYSRESTILPHYQAFLAKYRSGTQPEGAQPPISPSPGNE